MSKKIFISDIFRALSDLKTQNLLDSIKNTPNPDSMVLLEKLQLSRRQFYDRIRDLAATGLIKREKGRYRLSSFGKVILYFRSKAEKATKNYWKFEVMDGVRSYCGSNFTEGEYMKVVDIFLDDEEIKDVYLYGEENLSTRGRKNEITTQTH